MNSTVIKIREDEEYIKLGQALKKAGLVSSGVEAKIVINDGLVKVNGEVDTRCRDNRLNNSRCRA